MHKKRESMGAILLLDDSDDVRNVVRTVLTRSGFCVYAAGTFEEALSAWRAHSGEIGLILSDIILPEGFGTDLAHQLQQEKTDLKALFISGEFPNQFPQRDSLIEGRNLLLKPFSVSSLLTFVRNAEPF